MNRQGLGRRLSWLVSMYYPAVRWRYWERLWKASVRIATIPAEI